MCTVQSGTSNVVAYVCHASCVVLRSDESLIQKWGLVMGLGSKRNPVQRGTAMSGWISLTKLRCS